MAKDPRQAEWVKKMAQLVAKAWSDPGFKKQLLSNPKQVLAANGIDVPAGMDVRLVENSETVMHVVLPAKPAGDLSVEQLHQVAAAGLCNTGTGNVGLLPPSGERRDSLA
ncbi:MAG TPA: NHLP leader peptide family RiPP precursor [bacterium]|nr:NHLP leader peptide family RiPP precursor [bacterium]